MSGWITFIPGYLVWHYTRALKDFFKTSLNFVWFFYYFFSLSVLVKTFFSPFRRMGETYKTGLDVEAFLETFVVNTLMRIVGMIFRMSAIMAGVITIVFTVVLEAVLFGVWLVLPALVIILFIVGITGINV